jgi:hypothetical protein
MRTATRPSIGIIVTARPSPSSHAPTCRPLSSSARATRDQVLRSLDPAWPDSLLEWTFTHVLRPGLTLRRSMRLFDEVGRIRPPGYDQINLMEDLETHNLPPASLANAGILDV